MRWWSHKPQSGISQVLDSAAYCYVIMPRRPCYYIPRNSYHMSSSAHLGVPCLHPIIFAYQMKSFAHLGISCLRPSIATSHPSTPPPSSFYCVMLFPNPLLLLASRKIPAKVARSCSSVASWHHQAYLLHPASL